MELEFSSLNPYQSLAAITEDSPALLVEALKKIRTPIKVLAICHSGNRATAYIVGDIRPTQKLKPKGDRNGSSSKKPNDRGGVPE